MIEVLVMWNNESPLSAQWVSQSQLQGKGLKALTEYIRNQYLFSPLWKHVLNIAEVGVWGRVHRRNKSIISPSLLSCIPIFLSFQCRTQYRSVLFATKSGPRTTARFSAITVMLLFI